MSLHTMPVNVGDLLRDTQKLNAEAFGAYHAILYALWGSQGELPLDSETLCRIARVKPSKWEKVWEKLVGYFEVDGTIIRQKRVTKTLEKVSKKVATNAANGSAGGKAKALKDKEKALANAKANATPKSCQSKSKTNSPYGEGSEAKASGADAPPDPEQQDRDFVWNVGKDLLIKTGADKKSAGSTIGALVREKGLHDAKRIIITAQAKPPLEAKSYIWKIINGDSEKGTDSGAAPQLELVLVDGKPTLQPVARVAA